MKYRILLYILLSSLVSFGQHKISWLATSEVASKIYGNLHPRIKLDKNHNPMIVWGNDAGKAYFAKWGGESFNTPMEVSPAGKQVFTSSWSGPDIAVQGDNVFIVYKQLPEDSSNIYLMHSYDAGKHFSIPLEVDEKSSWITRFPTVTTDESGNPFVAFMKADRTFESFHYAVARSNDMGETFIKDTMASVLSGQRVCDCSPASLVVSGNAGVLMYRNHLGSQRNIYAGISTNACLSFNQGMRIDSTDYAPEYCPASAPSSVLIGDTLYTVYMSGESGKKLIYLSRLSLSTYYNSTELLTGNIPGVIEQNYPRISGLGNAAAIVWTQTAGGNNQVCMALTDDLTQGMPSHIDTVANGVMLNADVALGGGHVYVVWEDQVTRNVMFRKGIYQKQTTVRDNTTIIISPPAKGQKYFLVRMPNIEACALVDTKGNNYETDVVYPKGREVCRVSIDEIDPGVYSVRLWDKDGKIYNAQVEIK